MINHCSSRFDKPVVNTTETTDATASIALLEDTHGPRRNVRLTNRRLTEVVSRDTKTINWHLLRCSVVNWDKTPSNLGFAVYTTRTHALRRVMASGTIPCSVEEIRQVLRPSTSDSYAAIMHELFGEDFVHGAIVHRVSDTETGSNEDNVDPVSGKDTREFRRHRPKVNDISVKTALFAKRHALARNEQWCFVDCTQILGGDNGDGFSVTMSTLDSGDVFAGKCHTRDCDVRQMHGIRAGYAVVPVVTKEVRVSFYAHFLSDSASNRDRSHSFLFTASNATARIKQGVSSRAQMKRLTMMAHATARLAVLVRRRRLGAQKMTSRTYMARNTRCVCCASTMRSSTHLGLSSKKRVRRQCQLCGYYVCEGCSSNQEAQRSQDNAFSVVRICDNCMERVDDAVYDAIPADNSETLEPTIHPNAPGSEVATKVLARLLRDTLVNASEPELPAVKNVIMQLVEEEVKAPASPQPSEHPYGRRLTMESSQEDYLLALQSQLQIPERPLSSCTLAGASGRAYPLAYSDSNAGVPLFPLPDNELERLRAVNKARLTEVRNLPELELICTLASKELCCKTTLVTLINHDTQYILASNNPVFRNGAGPRDQALCAHTIMGQLPMLVPHTAADCAV
ncbi:hypothetical protein PHMEG_00010983 [Phytophthora megakarya]|uniref:FYVE-type domain-containing protein n=1 Tax=Phytophthora megakarya TaxID=4795 RepID=A0A225WDA5_9STRA|nr:hypothetical protein PHMEG_00010983 [Phytophthora megakarya]